MASRASMLGCQACVMLAMALLAVGRIEVGAHGHTTIIIHVRLSLPPLMVHKPNIPSTYLHHRQGAHYSVFLVFLPVFAVVGCFTCSLGCAVCCVRGDPNDVMGGEGTPLNPAAQAGNTSGAIQTTTTAAVAAAGGSGPGADQAAAAPTPATVYQPPPSSVPVASPPPVVVVSEQSSEKRTGGAGASDEID